MILFKKKKKIFFFVFFFLRYRKQMEEMQKAFNKTIIKLQNTSRIAEEQVNNNTVFMQSSLSDFEMAASFQNLFLLFVWTVEQPHDVAAASKGQMCFSSKLLGSKLR